MNRLQLTHLGGPTVLAEVDGTRILTDPTFDPPGRRYSFGWGTASTKIVGPALCADQLGRIDAVLLSHDHHADNLDDAGREILERVPVVVTTAVGADRLGAGAIGLRPWDRFALPGSGLTVTATPCRHGPPLSRPVAGPVIGFAVAAGSAPALWFSGDTVLYRGLRSVADRIEIDVAVVHLGAVRFPVTGPLRYSMTIDDALELCATIAPRVAVPVHFDGWSHFSQPAADVRRRLAERIDPRVERFRVLDPGVATDLSPLPTGTGPELGAT